MPKSEQRALNRETTTEVVLSLVAYASKHHRWQWSALADAGEAQIILQTGTNLLPAIARQARCEHISNRSLSGIDIPGIEPQFHMILDRPVELIQSAYGYGRQGGLMEQDDAPKCCSMKRDCCFRVDHRPRVCLLKVVLTTPNRFRSVKQLPRTDLIQMLQLIDREELAKATALHVKKKRRRLMLPSEKPHYNRLAFNFAKNRIYTVEGLWNIFFTKKFYRKKEVYRSIKLPTNDIDAAQKWHALQASIPDLQNKKFLCPLLKKLRVLMDDRFMLEGIKAAEERMRIEIIQAAEEETRIATENLQRIAEELKQREKKQGEKEGEKEGEKKGEKEDDKDEDEIEKEEEKEGKKEEEQEEHEVEERKKKEEEDKERQEQEKKEKEETDEVERRKKLEAEEKEEKMTEEERKKSDEEAAMLQRQELEKEMIKRAKEEEEKLLAPYGRDKEGEPLPEPLIVSIGASTADLYASLDLSTMRSVHTLYVSRENVDEDTQLMNPFAQAALISIHSKRGSDILMSWLLRQLYHLSYQEVDAVLQEILRNNQENVVLETNEHKHFMKTKMNHVVFGSYFLQGTWHLVVDIRQRSPIDLNRTLDRMAAVTTKKERGQVRNYTPRETYELFIDLILEAKQMKMKLNRCFELGEIMHGRKTFYKWRGERKETYEDGMSKSLVKEKKNYKVKRRRKSPTIMEIRSQVKKEYPYVSNKFRYLYQMIEGLEKVSLVSSKYLYQVIAGQLRIDGASEDQDMIEAAADASSEFAPTPTATTFHRLRSEVHLDAEETKTCFEQSGVLLPLIIESDVWVGPMEQWVDDMKQSCYSCMSWAVHCGPCFAPCYFAGCCQGQCCSKDLKSGEKEMKELVKELIRNAHAKEQVRKKKEEVVEEQRERKRMRNINGEKKSQGGGCSKYAMF